MSTSCSDAQTRRLDERRNAAVAAVDAVEGVSEKIVTRLPFGVVSWRVWGEAGKPELVLIHGGSGSWRHWIANVLDLSRKYRVVVPDIPGFGDSAMLPAPQTPDQIAGALSAGLDQILKGGRFHLAGFSFGSVISGHLAAYAPRIASLALVGAVGLGGARNTRPQLVRVHADWPAADRWINHARNLSLLMIHDAERIDDLAIHIQDINGAHARFNSSVLSRQETLGGALAKVAVPVAAVWGENDSIYAGHGLEERAALLASLPQGEKTDLIPNGGHWIGYECSEAFNNWLLAWLGDHPLS